MSQLKVNKITDLNNDNLFKPNLMTAINTTSGTYHDFIGIPAWAKKITVIVSGVSTNGTSLVIVQVGGASGFLATGYVSVGTQGTTEYTSTAGLVFASSVAAGVRTGSMTLVNLADTSWVSFGSNACTTTTACAALAGRVTMSEPLTSIRLTTINGTDTFDAGVVNVMYE